MIWKAKGGQGERERQDERNSKNFSDVFGLSIKISDLHHKKVCNICRSVWKIICLVWKIGGSFSFGTRAISMNQGRLKSYSTNTDACIIATTISSIKMAKNSLKFVR